MDSIVLTEEESDAIVCFIKNHERDEIPDDVWDVCMKLCDKLDRL